MYTVTVTDNNNCSNTATVQVNLGQIPTITISPSNPAICEGDTTQLTASGGVTYSWAPAGSVRIRTLQIQKYFRRARLHTL